MIGGFIPELATTPSSSRKNVANAVEVETTLVHDTLTEVLFGRAKEHPALRGHPVLPGDRGRNAKIIPLSKRTMGHTTNSHCLQRFPRETGN